MILSWKRFRSFRAASLLSLPHLSPSRRVSSYLVQVSLLPSSFFRVLSYRRLLSWRSCFRSTVFRYSWLPRRQSSLGTLSLLEALPRSSVSRNSCPRFESKETQSLINSTNTSSAARASRTLLIRGLPLVLLPNKSQFHMLISFFIVAIGFISMAILALFLPYFLNMYVYPLYVRILRSAFQIPDFTLIGYLWCRLCACHWRFTFFPPCSTGSSPRLAQAGSHISSYLPYSQQCGLKAWPHVRFLTICLLVCIVVGVLGSIVGTYWAAVDLVNEVIHGGNPFAGLFTFGNKIHE